jgi:hypothetical protein
MVTRSDMARHVLYITLAGLAGLAAGVRVWVSIPIEDDFVGIGYLFRTFLLLPLLSTTSLVCGVVFGALSYRRVQAARPASRRLVWGALLSLMIGGGVSSWAEYGSDEVTPEAIESSFRDHIDTFVALRDRFRVDVDLHEVRIDAFSWTEPCNLPAPRCPTPRPRRGALPPGQAPRPCHWINGCLRWVDRSPTSADIAAIGNISPGRAATYLEGLRKIKALSVGRGSGPRSRTGSCVVFVMHRQGIIPSGSSLSILHCSASPLPVTLRPGETHNTGDAHMGSAWRHIKGGWYLRDSWN